MANHVYLLVLLVFITTSTIIEAQRRPETPAPLLPCTVINASCYAKAGCSGPLTCTCIPQKKTYWDCLQLTENQHCYNTTTSAQCVQDRDVACAKFVTKLTCIDLSTDNSMAAWLIAVIVISVILGVILLIVCFVKREAITDKIDDIKKKKAEEERQAKLRDPEEPAVPLSGFRTLPVDFNVKGGFANPVMKQHYTDGSAKLLGQDRETFRDQSKEVFYGEMLQKHDPQQVATVLTPPAAKLRALQEAQQQRTYTPEEIMTIAALNQHNPYALTAMVARSKLVEYLQRPKFGNNSSSPPPVDVSPLLEQCLSPSRTRALSTSSGVTPPVSHHSATGVPPYVAPTLYHLQGPASGITTFIGVNPQGPVTPQTSSRFDPRVVPPPEDYIRLQPNTIPQHSTALSAPYVPPVTPLYFREN
eukprot:PhF_6_TR42857/c0_g1_i1/m.64914